jgi:hypothetical protein
MQTLYIGFIGSTVSTFDHALAIRIAYLLSNKFLLCGDLSDLIIARKKFEGLSYESKLIILEDFYKDDQRFMESYEAHRRIVTGRSKKRISKKDFALYKKKSEKTLLDFYDHLMDYIETSNTRSGMATMKDILSNPGFGEYYIHPDHVEGGTEDSSFSEILLLDLEEQDLEEPSIFVLNGDYLSESLEHRDVLLQGGTAFSEKGFLVEIFSFPDITVLSAADIALLRLSVNDSLTGFQQHINVFTSLQEKPLEAFVYMNTTVVPAASLLSQRLNDTELAARFDALLSGTVGHVKVDIGLVPYCSLFKYFEFIEAAPKETMAIIEQLPDEQKNKLVPVMITRALAVEHKEETVSTTKALLPIKRSLSID